MRARSRLLLAALLANALAPAAMSQELPSGISFDLATQRSERISDVRYELRFDLVEDGSSAEVRCKVTFTLPETAAPQIDVWLDYAGEAELREVTLNGLQPDQPLRWSAGHVVLPGPSLTAGPNTLEARFETRLASTGTPLTRYVDETSGDVYVYSLLVPADAHRLFPCFDQPDLRAKFDLQLHVPRTWTAVANAPVRNDPSTDPYADPPREVGDGKLCYDFDRTEPIPTYLFAFAAGPFAVVTDSEACGLGADPGRLMRLVCRPDRVEHLDAAALFELHRSSAAKLGEWFGVAYPFAKLDFVLLPGFPYGGMEHAGAIFYRENALVYERSLSTREAVSRSTLIYHEVAHQWFGNLVTMRWFDDLWMKEGFATLLSFQLLADLQPDRKAWLRFLQRIKPAAYAVDVTPGTTAIYQPLDNLADAKSNYGPIVYDKAPAVLHELSGRIGERSFRLGLQTLVADTAFGAVTWRDVISALQTAAADTDSRWPQRWLLGRGMPDVAPRFEVDADGNYRSFAIEQIGADGPETSWPLSFELLLVDDEGRTRGPYRVTSDGATSAVNELVDQPAARAVLLNSSDQAYGRFRCDVDSENWLLEHLHGLTDPLLRSVAIVSLEHAVQDARLAPARFATAVLNVLEIETDAETHGWLLQRLRPALRRWTRGDTRSQLAERAASLLLAQLREAPQGQSTELFRFLLENLAEDERVRSLLTDVLSGDRTLPGLPELDKRDRFAAAAALLAQGDEAAVDREVERLGDTAGDLGREVYVAGAASPDAATKDRYFASYLAGDEPPERWISDSLATFHWPGQQPLTVPHLRTALERLEWIRRERRIFFLQTWLDAFVASQTSPEALGIVEQFLTNRPDLPADIRRKLLQSLDVLRRTVRIRARFPS